MLPAAQVPCDIPCTLVIGPSVYRGHSVAVPLVLNLHSKDDMWHPVGHISEQDLTCCIFCDICWPTGDGHQLKGHRAHAHQRRLQCSQPSGQRRRTRESGRWWWPQSCSQLGTTYCDQVILNCSNNLEMRSDWHTVLLLRPTHMQESCCGTAGTFQSVHCLYAAQTCDRVLFTRGLSCFMILDRVL